MSESDKAIKNMRTASIDAVKTDYGFALRHHDSPSESFAQCGYEHDGSISMSVTTEDSPPVHWFFRLSFSEMARLIIAAYASLQEKTHLRRDILDALKKQDALYDETLLNVLTRDFPDTDDTEADWDIKTMLQRLAAAKIAFPEKLYQEEKRKIMSKLCDLCGCAEDLADLEAVKPNLLSRSDMNYILQHSALARRQS